MIAFDCFEQGLQEALNHLYDPAYQPPGVVSSVLGIDPRLEPQATQAAVIRSIEALAPGPQVPPSARSRRIYMVLASRYIQKMTQEEAADRLGITPRHLRREQAQAVNTLARQLWERYGGPAPPETPVAEPTDTPAEAEPPAWLSQVREELHSLEKRSDTSVAGVGEAIASVVELMSSLAARHGVTLSFGHVPEGLAAAIHPSVLRQVLVHTLAGLIRLVPSGTVAVLAAGAGQSVRIVISADPAPGQELPGDELAHELLADYHGTIERQIAGFRIDYIVTLPAASEVTVLVVDDNPDLVHFYRRYVQGTRYHIVALAEGARLLETIQTIAPDVIVLDVMLPDADGWELLAHLHNHPATRSIPVVLCSVVREEELALALGAAVYVPKPVRRQEFVRALDQALTQAASKPPGAPASTV